MKPLFCFFLALLGTVTIVQVAGLNMKPVIGILSFPSQFEQYDSTKWNYISLSAVKFIEAGGARVVPVQWDLPIDNLTSLINSLNGLYIPSSKADLLFTEKSVAHLAFRQALENVLDIVSRMINQAIIFPILGTGTGFQALVCAFASQERGDYACLSEHEGFEGARKNLSLTAIAKKTGMLDTSLLPGIETALQEKEIAYFDTRYLIDDDLWYSTTNLLNNFAVVAYVNDTTIPAVIIGKRYRIYATASPVELYQYEWSTEGAIPHNYEAVLSAQMYSTYFVEQSRYNDNNFDELGVDVDPMAFREMVPVDVKDTSTSKVYLFKGLGTKAESENTENNGNEL